MNTKSYCYDTIIGRICISDDGKGISLITLGEEENSECYEETGLIKMAYTQLSEYLAGKRFSFDVPLSVSGTLFQEAVWQALLEIPYGSTNSYSQLASNIKRPKSSRAVGGACNKNPVMIMIPCHRVVGKDNSLTGYALGLDVKEKLLALEAENRKIISK